MNKKITMDIRSWAFWLGMYGIWRRREKEINN